MSDQKREIDRALRKAFLGELWRSKFGIAFAIFVVLVIAGLSAFGTMNVRLRETALGYGIGEFVVPEDDGPQIHQVTVQLEDGRVVILRFPKTEQFRRDTPMKVAAYERGWGPFRKETWRFAGYGEKGD